MLVAMDCAAVAAIAVLLQAARATACAAAVDLGLQMPPPLLMLARLEIGF